MPGPMSPSKPGGLFFGDYSGLAAYGGRVYGVWTEKPASTASDQTSAEQKTPPEEQKNAKKEPKGTVIKLGTADFTPNAQ